MNRLVMLEMEMPDGAMSKAWPEGNLSVWSAGRVVGNVTSGTYSPATNKGENLFVRQYYMNVEYTFELHLRSGLCLRPERV